MQLNTKTGRFCPKGVTSVKRILISNIIALLMMTGVAYTSQFNVVKQAGDVTVRVVVENDPLKIGSNNVIIELLDGKEKAVTDADVAVYYFMPSMPAMNYEVQALPDGNKYTAVIKPLMPGAWDADIKVKRNGRDLQKATISLNAK